MAALFVVFLSVVVATAEETNPAGDAELTGQLLDLRTARTVANDVKLGIEVVLSELGEGA